MLLTTPEELNQIELIEEGLLTNDPSFIYWKNRIEPIYLSVLEESTKFTYRPYQSKYSAMFCLRRENIMSHSMGVGKTTQTGLMIAALYPDLGKGKVGRVQIAVPNILAATRWLEDLNLIPSLKGQFEYIKSEKQLLNSKAAILVYSHDFPKLKSKTLGHRSRAYISRLLAKRFKPSLLVVDEVHFLGSEGSQRREHLYYVRQRSKRVIGLTGTLSDGKLDMIHSICQFVYRQHWKYSKKEFVGKFSDKKKSTSNYLTGAEGDGEQNRYLSTLDWDRVEEYYALMRCYVHRLTLDEPEVREHIKLPKRIENLVIVEPSRDQVERYRNYIDSHFALLKAAAVSNQQRLRTLNLIHPLIETSNSSETENIPKVQTLLDLANNYRKVVVFVSQVKTSRYLYNILRDYFGGECVVRLYAQDPDANPKVLNDNQRCEVLYKFQHDPSIRAGVFSLNIASTAIDLTSADCIIHYEVGWSSLKVLQSIARVIRPGNTHTEIPHYYLVNKGLIDEHQFNLLSEKLKVSKMLLDYQDTESGLEEDTSGDINPNKVLTNVLKEYD